MAEKKAQLTPEQKTEYEEAFRIMDKNAGGDIDAGEVAVVMKSFGVHPVLEDIEAMIEQATGGQKKTLSFDNFLTLMAMDVQPQNSKELLEAFRTFDKDGSGVVDLSELKQLLMREHCNLSPAEIDDALKKADLNGDGHIHYKEWVNTMTTI
eukprot:g29152.t1